MFEKNFKEVDFTSEKYTTITALEKNIPVYKRGHGAIPLLVLGQATLFKKPGLIPRELNDCFTIYFADLFEKTQKTPLNFTKLALNDFVDQIENIRLQLSLDKIALFGHSAAGIIAIEYATKYNSNLLLNILVGTAPIWGDYKKDVSIRFFQHNSSGDRKQLFDQDQKILAEIKNRPSKLSGDKQFIYNYNARRAHFYYEPLLPEWEGIWSEIDLDEDLINRYFELIKEYDIRNSNYKNKNVPTFLALGLYDYSCPFYEWTDVIKTTLANIEYYIFEKSGHYPLVEEPELFSEKLLEYVRRNVELSSEPSQHSFSKN